MGLLDTVFGVDRRKAKARDRYDNIRAQRSLLAENVPDSQARVSNFLKGVPAGAAGLLGDLGDLNQITAMPGYGEGLLSRLPNTDEVGQMMGADVNSRAFLMGSIGSPDPTDAAKVAARYAPEGLLGAMTLFHGTPHKFDKFSLDAIGTGEGSQAYGHGLYFAENPSVAESYQTSLAGGDLNINKPGATARILDNMDAAAYRTNSDDPDTILKSMRDNPESALTPDEQAFMDDLTAADIGPTEGHIYEVDIPDETIDKMLDWDAPLSEQPESVRKVLAPMMPKYAQNKNAILSSEASIRQALTDLLDTDMAKSFPNDREIRWAREILTNPDYDVAEDGAALIEHAFRAETGSVFYNLLGSNKGGALYGRLSAKLGGQEEASRALNEAGIPGIRFYDGNSRAADEGTRNIVVFNPDDIREVKRDGEVVFKR